MNRHHSTLAAAALAAGLATALIGAAPEPAAAPWGKETPWRFVAWQGDQTLVTVSATHAVAWDVATGKPRAQRRLGPAHVRAESPVSPDGKRLVVVGDAKAGAGRIVPLGDGPEIVLAAGPKDESYQFLSWSPDGGRLLLVDGDHVLHLWDSVSGKYAGKVGGPSDDPAAGRLTFVPPNNYLRASHTGKPLPNNKVDARFNYENLGPSGGGAGSYGDAEAWRRILWSPDGRALLTMARMNCPFPLVVLWDGRTGEGLASLSAPGRLYHQWGFSPDGRQFALLSAAFDEGREKQRDTPWHEALPDLDPLEVGPEAVALRLLHPETGATSHRLDVNFSPHSFAWSPDARRLLVVGRGLNRRYARTRELACWDAATGRPLWSKEWQPKESKAGVPVFSPDGQHVAFAVMRPARNLRLYSAANDTLEWWLFVLDADTGKPILQSKFGKPQERESPFPVSMWSPTGNRILAGSLVVDLKAGKAMFDLFPPRKNELVPAFQAAWQPGGKLLAVWQEEAGVRLVSAADGKVVRQLPEVKP